MKSSTWKPEQGVVTTDANPNFDAQLDLIVVGLGSAGSIALITAARRKLKVLGIDKLPLMGGSGTAGGIASYYRGIPGGIFEAVDLRAKAIELDAFIPAGKLHPEARHLALEEAAVAAGASLAYASRVIAVYLEGHRVCGIRLLTPAGARDLACEMLIDATGDGEVCALAGCAFTHGREFDGIPQPYSHVPCRVVDGQNGSQNFDAASTAPADDGETLSQAMAHGGTFHLRDPYTEDEKFLFSGRLLGLREGRLITGETTLTLRQYLDGKLSDQPVFQEFANLDTHTQDWAFESDTVQEWLTVASLWGLDFSVPVPLEAMIPKGFEGLMTAGRCLSVDHDLSQAVRMQRAMQQCGEAVATACALAREQGLSVRDLPYESLASELRRTGCLPASVPPTVTQQLSDNLDVIRAGLASEAPGLTIWSARQLGDAARAPLRDCLSDPDSHLARNAALALGLLGDPAALPVLRRIIRERDPFLPKSSRNQNARRLCAALYLAARLGDSEILDDAATLLAAPESAFDVFSYAFTTLLRLGNAHPAQRPKVAEALRIVLENDDFQQIMARHRSRWQEPSEAYFRIAAARELDRWRLPHKLMAKVNPTNLTFRETGLYRQQP